MSGFITVFFDIYNEVLRTFFYITLSMIGFTILSVNLRLLKTTSSVCFKT